MNAPKILILLAIAIGFCCAGGVEKIHHARKDAEKNARAKDFVKQSDKWNTTANDILEMVRAERRYYEPQNCEPLDLAPEFRRKNVGGSCVHCSTVMNLRWLGMYEEANYWWDHYRGGESDTPHRKKMDAMGLKYKITTDGDEKIFEYGFNTRRGVICTAYGAHMVWCVGKTIHDGEICAVILDNNRIGEFRYQEWGAWMKNFRSCGGWGVVILSGKPQPPTPR